MVKDSYKAYDQVQQFTAHHYLELTEKEREEFNISDGEFLIRLLVDGGQRAFKVFRNEDEPIQWTTNASSVVIDEESVEVIGSIIDAHYN